MNWLAHLYLSEPEPEFLLGSILPDFMGPAEMVGMPAAVLAGAERHPRIDALTDGNPHFKTSVGRIAPPHRRFGGIAVDLFYDHLLARDWSRYSARPFSEYRESIHDGLRSVRQLVPAKTRERLDWMTDSDLLGSYAEISRIREALERVGRRFKRPVDLGPAIEDLVRNRAGFEEDFAAFFPELRASLKL